MKYLIFTTEQDALDRSQEICIQTGCTGDVTIYWFGCIVNQNTLEGALEVPEDQENFLTTQEISELKDQQYMVDNGWFPEII